MLFRFSLLYLIIFCSSMFSQSYQLIWSDEFNGTTINTNNWTHEIGGHGWGNNELQYYTDRSDNSYIENGNLVIEAKAESYSGRNYTSARLITEHKQYWTYGRIEARMKLPYGQGIWPAFWMLGENFDDVSWPYSGEIDIMEMIGGGTNDKRCYGTIHWYSNGHASYGGNYYLSNGTLADNYHIYAVEWTPNYIRWTFDGIQFAVVDITPSDLEAFHKNFFILLNLAVGGDWPGNPDASTVFPQKLYVDYVRVYADANALPSVSLSTPSVNANYNVGDDIAIIADVDFDGEIEAVNFYQDNVKIGSTSIAPYKMTWRNVAAGCYKIKAEAVTNTGYKGETQVIDVTVGDECGNSPYKGYPHLIPGKVEAENFNTGEAGVAYSDNEVLNQGSSYRLGDQVDIQTCSDIGGGYNVGYTVTGEWMNYTIYVDDPGTYNFTARVASDVATGKFRAEIDDTDVTGTVNVSATGGWQEWDDVTVDNINLTEGEHILKLYIEGNDLNINYFELYKADASPSINLISPNGGEVWGTEGIYEIRWRSVLVDNVALGLSTDNGSSWEFIEQNESTEFGVYRWKTPNVVSSDCIIMITDKANSSTRDMSDATFTLDKNVAVDDDIVANLNFELEQNYPNPFNPSTKISFSVAEYSSVKLKVFNTLGKEVATLLNNNMNAGKHSVSWNASNLPSGIYFYTIEVTSENNNFTQTKKMLLLK